MNKLLFFLFFMLLNGCANSLHNNYSCLENSDCKGGFSCRSKIGGGTECRESIESAEFKPSYSPPKKEYEPPKKEITECFSEGIYKYVDSDGRTYYSDCPKDSNFKLIIKSKSLDKKRNTNLSVNVHKKTFKKDINAAEKCKKAIIDILKDPESARFGEFTQVTEKLACLTYNAKNGFGGYNGKTQAILIKIGSNWLYQSSHDDLRHDDCIKVLRQSQYD